MSVIPRNRKPIRFLAERVMVGLRVDVYAQHQSTPTSLGWGLPTEIVFDAETEENVGIIREPTFSFDYDSAQSLLDALWDAGVRPSEGAGLPIHVTALENHLDDMRALVAAYIADGKLPERKR